MQMTVFGSGSAGNCYLLHSPTEALIIEAGVRPEARMYACFESDFSRLAGLLVSHRHADHAAYARQWSEGGVPVLATADVMERHAIHDPFSTTITPGRWATVGRFRVLPFPLIHYDPDGTRCPNVGFVIDHPETGRILFATDCESLSREELTPQGMRYTPYQFTGVVHWMLEANYDDYILHLSDIPSAQKDRIRQSHLSVADAHTILRPFYPGGDYERAEYPENGIVIDNPPFSIFTKICKFYTARHIPFFLFGPGMTIATVSTYATAVIISCRVTFENGANVRVNFASSLFPDVAMMTAPRLNDLIRACPSQNQKKELPIYDTPDELLSVSDLQTICNGGIDFAVRRSECVRVRSLDLHPKRGGLFGDHFLIAKAKAKAKRAIHIQFSEREQRIVERLGADTAPPAEQ